MKLARAARAKRGHVEKKFKFSLNDRVVIDVSSQAGTVVARCDYLTNESSYLIRYKSGDGDATQAWWDESALSALT